MSTETTSADRKPEPDLPRRRFLFILAKWLVLGTITTRIITTAIYVLVHNGRHLPVTFLMASKLKHLRIDDPFEWVPPNYWALRRDRFMIAPGYSRLRVSEGLRRGLPAEYFNHPMTNSTQGLRLTRETMPEHPWLNDDLIDAIVQAPQPSVIAIRHYGWPFRWIQSSFTAHVYESRGFGTRGNVRVHVQDGIHIPPSDAGRASHLLGVRLVRFPFGMVIPMRMLVLPLLANSIFFGLILWWLFARPLRVWRRQSGRCPDCGYDILSGLAPARTPTGRHTSTGGSKNRVDALDSMASDPRRDPDSPTVAAPVPATAASSAPGARVCAVCGRPFVPAKVIGRADAEARAAAGVAVTTATPAADTGARAPRPGLRMLKRDSTAHRADPGSGSRSERRHSVARRGAAMLAPDWPPGERCEF